MEYFKLEKPKVLDADRSALFTVEGSQVFARFNERVTKKEYLYWDKARWYLEKYGLKNNGAAWELVETTRALSPLFVSPIKYYADKKNEKPQMFFVSGAITQKLSRLEHRLDRTMQGSPSGFIRSGAGKQYLLRGLLEEAIYSAILEGAETKLKDAEELISSGRKPVTLDERMVKNSYEAMLRVENQWKDVPLTAGLLLEFHKMLTAGTENKHFKATDSGRFRTFPEDQVYVVDKSTGVCHHEAPSAEFVLQEIPSLIEFANRENKNDDDFIHPFVKACILHFWIGYLHPFMDGNGRMARLLFYWSLLHDGYKGITALPISSEIKKARNGYDMSYVYAEQGGRDLSYFLDYQVGIMEKSMDSLSETIDREDREFGEFVNNNRFKELNSRQRRVMFYFFEHPIGTITLKTYETKNGVSSATAAKDIKDLVRKHILLRNTKGREVWYSLAGKLK